MPTDMVQLPTAYRSLLRSSTAASTHLNSRLVNISSHPSSFLATNGASKITGGLLAENRADDLVGEEEGVIGPSVALVATMGIR